MIAEDVIVFEYDNGRDYVALIGEHWHRWPAVQGGWLLKSRFPEPTNDALLTLQELPPFNARLALRLSGVEA